MNSKAFGAPGIAPTWCSSDKDFVTTSLGSSRLWATIGHGIINEVYWPSTGEPQIRDFGFYLVGNGRWIDLKRVSAYQLSTPGPYLPALTITHHGQDYELSLEVLPDPRRDVLLVRYTLMGDYRLVILLAPHLGSTGRDNSAWIDDGLGFASGAGLSLCLAADPPLTQFSCGYVGHPMAGRTCINMAHSPTASTMHSNGTIALTAAVTAAAACWRSGFHTRNAAPARSFAVRLPMGSRRCGPSSLKPGMPGAHSCGCRGRRSLGDAALLRPRS